MKKIFALSFFAVLFISCYQDVDLKSNEVDVQKVKSSESFKALKLSSIK